MYRTHIQELLEIDRKELFAIFYFLFFLALLSTNYNSEIQLETCFQLFKSTTLKKAFFEIIFN
jgi:hypothetical protein